MGLLSKDNKVKPQDVTADVLLLGASGSGKTLLTKSLRCTIEGIGNFHLATTPTYGVDLHRIHSQKYSIVLREVGGVMKLKWAKFAVDCRVILLSESIAYLLETLQCSHTQGLTVIIALNKGDVESRVPLSVVKLLMRFEDLNATCSQNLLLLEVSAATGHGINLLCEHLIDAKTKVRGFFAHN